MYIIKKVITLSLAILLNLNSSSGLFFLGDETRNCLATALEAQGALLSAFNLTSLPIQIVNKLFKEASNKSASKDSQKNKQNHSRPVNQPAISEFKPVQTDKKFGNINNYTFAPVCITAVHRKYLSGCLPIESRGLLFLYFLSFLIILSLSNLPAYLSGKLNRLFLCPASQCRVFLF